MALTEIEFELPAQQYELMGFPGLSQGQPLTLQLDMGPLLPDPSGDGWFTVQKEAIAEKFVRVGRARYAFSGQIVEADLVKDDEVESATVLVRCGEVPLRVACAPDDEGRLPYGTWETRYMTGWGRLIGTVEDDFSSAVGSTVSVTIWSFRRLILRPGDPLFGEWHESDSLC
jgi:hypothetical protein